MHISFERFTCLQYELKDATRQLEAFKSGEKYVDMKKKHEQELRYLEGIIRNLRMELEQAHLDNKKLRRMWFETCDDMQKELDDQTRASEKQIKQLQKKVLQTETQRDNALEQLKQQRHRACEAEAELEVMKEKNLKLTAVMNKDFENSSLPSSAQSTRRKKIPNSRECTGRKPGAQPGHKGHHRKHQTPTCPPVLLMPKQEILDDPDYKKTKKVITKQLVNIRVIMEVTEYQAEIYRNSKTGETYHAEFPAGVIDDVNYGGSIKAFLFLLNNECCVSIDKCRAFLSNLTDGKLQISKGMINKLSKEFAQKGTQQQQTIFSELLCSPVMHTDCTNARMNGKSTYVFICAAPNGAAMYFAREKKGHEGVKGTPVEIYQGTLVHDHEKTFFNYGSNHQECLAHVLRYLKGSIENEPDRIWNTQMHPLIREMIHYRNELEAGLECDANVVQEFEARYHEILLKAEEEYEDIPCSDYYRDGYNLSKRMDEYQNAHLLFLHDCRIPITNNLAERLLRTFKRKQKQVMTFRSQESINYLCQSMNVLNLVCQENGNLYHRASEIFE